MCWGNSFLRVPQRRLWRVDSYNAFSARERDFAKRLSSGITIAMAAEALGLSAHTVRELTRRVYRKLGVTNRAQLALKLK